MSLKATRRGRFDGQIVIVTGGTSGIGKASAIHFAGEGATVVITGRRVERGEGVVREIGASGGKAQFIAADHKKPEDCRRVVETVIDQFGRVDILFNNAGIVVKGRADETTEDVWRDVMELNVTAVWRMSRLVLRHMRKQGKGVIVNNASDWGLVGGKEAVAYCASKGAVVQMTKAMALDHAQENIRINAVCPGDTYVDRWAESGYFESSGPADVATAKADLGRELPMGRVGESGEIARAVLFLASDDASFITGTALLVDGGNTAQ